VRPVNLIPPEQRRGADAPTRTGALSYVIVGVLAVVLIGVTATVIFGNKVSDKNDEIAVLEAKAAETSARAESLSTYTTFQGIHDARVETVSQLATSRFDWQRVLRELAKVLPQHVWLTSLTGTVSPDVQLQNKGEDGGLRDSIAGPALVVVGCGRTQDDVARLVAAMRDIDGVTRVTAADSAKPANDSGAAGDDSCQTKSSIPQFHLVAAFDGVTVAPAGGGAAGTTTESTTTESTTTESTTTTGTDGGVSGVEAQNQQAQDGVQSAQNKTDKATNLLPSGG
jgi:Tfp pilus assembly protein PilN